MEAELTPPTAPIGSPPLVAIVGATGTGKSELAIRLALALSERSGGAEIVNADAMQLYRGMDVGTAKVSEAERRGIRHHLFDVLEVTDEASVAAYQPQARALIEQIAARGAVPILVGGSGLYVSSVVYDFQFPGRDAAVRARLETELQQQGPGALYRRLKDADPVTAERIDPANGRRIVRALEVHELATARGHAGDADASSDDEPSGGTGHGRLGTLPEQPRLWRATTVIGLTTPRETLVQRLDARVEAMWRGGMLDEVRRLQASGLEQGITASRAIGYAQALGQLRGELSESEAIAQTQALTRRYARRQVGWFKRYPGALWLDTETSTVDERVSVALDRLS